MQICATSCIIMLGVLLCVEVVDCLYFPFVHILCSAIFTFNEMHSLSLMYFGWSGLVQKYVSLLTLR
jgi:hypothetical protein